MSGFSAPMSPREAGRPSRSLEHGGRVGGSSAMLVWMKTSLCSRLGIDLPIVQAPMAGGWTTPALVAAVCNAGGLGMLAAARLSLDQLREQIDAVRRLSSRPFGVNFLLAPPDAAPTDVRAIQRALDVGRSRLGLAPGSTSLQLPPSHTAAQ